MADYLRPILLDAGQVDIQDLGRWMRLCAGYWARVGLGATGAYRRDRATAYVVLGVLASASGQGVGGRLLDELDRWAAAHGVHRLELTVMASNERALRLYERKGYAREGRRRECFAVDHVLVDEFYMGKLL